MNEFKRKVVTGVSRDEEKQSMRGRLFSWRKIEITTVTAECGHTRVIRGLYPRVPKHFNPCKDCQAGKPRVPVEGLLGLHTHESDPNIRSRVARAIFNNAYGRRGQNAGK